MQKRRFVVNITVSNLNLFHINSFVVSFQRDMQSDDEEGSLKDFIDDDEDSLAESTSMDSSSSSDDDDVLSVNSDDKKNKKKELPQVARRTRANAKDCM